MLASFTHGVNGHLSSEFSDSILKALGFSNNFSRFMF